MSGFYNRIAGKTKKNSQKASIISSNVKSGKCNKNSGVNKITNSISVGKHHVNNRYNHFFPGEELVAKACSKT